MFTGFKGREIILTLFESITGLRMNSAYIRPGGVSQDLPPDAEAEIATALKEIKGVLREMGNLLNESAIWKARTKDVGTSTSPAVSPWESPGRSCGPPGCPTTYANQSPIADTRTTNSTSSPMTGVIPTAATSFASRRCRSR